MGLRNEHAHRQLQVCIQVGITGDPVLRENLGRDGARNRWAVRGAGLREFDSGAHALVELQVRAYLGTLDFEAVDESESDNFVTGSVGSQ